MADIVERLRSNEPLPICPYDRRSPDYWTAPNDKPCVFCGTLNDPDAPDLCRGADTRLFGEAATEIERLRAGWRKISKHYANQDMNHVDFRVMAKHLADELLEGRE